MAASILIVDDSATMRQMIRRSVQMAGLDVGAVHEAGNGIQGFAVLAAHPVDVVILDVNMPVMNGVQFLTRMHDDPRLRDVPVVIASTEGSDTRIQELLTKGARAFVRKPFQPEQIRAALEPFLGVRSGEPAGGEGGDELAF